MMCSLRSLLPKSVRSWYHACVACTAACWYRFPARSLLVIGVTGTHGKSSVVMLVGRMLEAAGHRVGWTTTATVKVADREWLNRTKMTMPGRFALQRNLRAMVGAGCDVAVIETSSEGLAQYRHIGIAYDAAVFLNLAPEHLESHGGWERYRAAKLRLFRAVAHRRRKVLRGQRVPRVTIINRDDREASHFRSAPADHRAEFSLADANDVQALPWGSHFRIDGVTCTVHLPGRMYLENALAAIATARAVGVSLPDCARALDGIEGLPGRMERITAGQPFTVVVDYAHTPAALEALYDALAVPPRAARRASQVTHVLGGVGGGRDRWKRAAMGEVAGRFADCVIVTNEDPYDEDPAAIIAEVVRGARRAHARVETIANRREALRAAITGVPEGGIVLVTGKGCEQAIVGRNGALVPWDDRTVLRELLRERAYDEASLA